MKKLNRREAAMIAASLSVGGMVGTSNSVLGQDEVNKPVDPPVVGNAEDKALVHAKQYSQSYMLVDAGTIQLDGDGRSRDLIVINALDERGIRGDVRIPSNAMRIFRAVAPNIEVTEKSILNWKFRSEEGQEGNVELDVPGHIVMVMRDGSNTARIFVMTLDVRC